MERKQQSWNRGFIFPQLVEAKLSLGFSSTAGSECFVMPQYFTSAVAILDLLIPLKLYCFSEDSSYELFLLCFYSIYSYLFCIQQNVTLCFMGDGQHYVLVFSVDTCFFPILYSSDHFSIFSGRKWFRCSYSRCHHPGKPSNLFFKNILFR